MDSVPPSRIWCGRHYQAGLVLLHCRGSSRRERWGGPGVSVADFPSVEQVITEVKRLQRQYDLREFFFIDQGFSVPPDFAKELCRGLLAEHLDIKWNTNLRGGRVRPGTSIADGSIGLPNGADWRAWNTGPSRAGGGDRKTTSTYGSYCQIGVLCDLCHSQGLAYSITQGFGEPGETEAMVSAKLTFLAHTASGDRSAHVTMRVGNRLLPGSDLTKIGPGGRHHPGRRAAVDARVLCCSGGKRQPGGCPGKGGRRKPQLERHVTRYLWP